MCGLIPRLHIYARNKWTHLPHRVTGGDPTSGGSIPLKGAKKQMIKRIFIKLLCFIDVHVDTQDSVLHGMLNSNSRPASASYSQMKIVTITNCPNCGDVWVKSIRRMD